MEFSSGKGVARGRRVQQLECTWIDGGGVGATSCYPLLVCCVSEGNYRAPTRPKWGRGIHVSPQ